MTYREPHSSIPTRVHALRPTSGRYETWCGLAGPEEPTDLVVSDRDRPCPHCVQALRAEVERNKRVLSHAG